MNHIRIAQGPPTEEGWYWYKWKQSDWGITIVYKCTRTTCNRGLMASFPGNDWSLHELRDEPIQWSTRIPDPEEMG